MVTRRSILALPLAALSLPARDGFRFVHFTDLHIQPELHAAEHCARCVEAINGTGASFAIAGGDLVFDANLASRQRAGSLVKLYQSTTSRLSIPFHNVIGNHDLFGI